MSDLPLDEAALDRAKKRIEHGDWPADNTLHALVAQSRAALTLRARVAELEAKCADLREDNAYFRKQSWEHCSHAAKLREALVKADAMIRKLLAGAVTDTGADETGAAIGAALASTPADSLAAHAAEVIERCAKWHDERANEADAKVDESSDPEWWDGMAEFHRDSAKGIRALAAQEVKP